MRRAGAVALASLVAAAPAAASPRLAPDLAVRELPPPTPTRLAMRASAATTAAAASTTPRAPAARRSIDDVGPAPIATRRDPDADAARDARLADQVVFRFNLGYGIDGGTPSGRPLRGGAALDEATYEPLRRYGYGDVALGSRGLLSPALGTYLAAGFRFDQPFDQASSAVPSVHDNPAVAELRIRSGWAEVDRFLDGKLAPLYLRAGRQYKYGVAVTQFDGVAAGYESAAISVSAYAGQRVFDWALAAPDPDAPADAPVDGQIGGLELRLDLFELRRLPLVVSFSSLRVDRVDHAETGVALRWSPDVLVRASVRTRDGDAARQSLSVWARLSEVTTLTVDVDHRSDADWMYDVITAGRAGAYAADDVRRWLDLGATLPRTLVDLRAGTVLLRNLDVLLRVGAGIDQRSDDDEVSPFAAGYVEGGVGLEVRLRRNLRLGTSLTARRYGKDEPGPLPDDAGAPDPLPALDAFGDRRSYEGGARIHYTAGARRFNAWAEVYGRAHELATPWRLVDDDTADLRTGGRFGVEGWAGERLRVRAEYDVSIAAIPEAPELLGVKSLRVLTEGSF